MNDKTQTKEMLSNCTIHKQLLTHLSFDISTLCFSYVLNINDTPLFKSIIMDDIQLLRYLVGKNIGLCKEEITALMWVAQAGNDKFVNILTKTKEIGMQTRYGHTALMWAASNGHDKCVEILAKTKELNMKDNYGCTALMCAALHGHDKCVEILAKTKELNIKDENGWTALMLAKAGKYDKCVKILNK